jgi:hypothetical protein
VRACQVYSLEVDHIDYSYIVRAIILMSPVPCVIECVM